MGGPHVPVLDELLLPRPVAAPHRLQLRQRHVRLVYDQQPVFFVLSSREVVQERVGGDAGGATRQVPARGLVQTIQPSTRRRGGGVLGVSRRRRTAERARSDAPGVVLNAAARARLPQREHVVLDARLQPVHDLERLALSGEDLEVLFELVLDSVARLLNPLLGSDEVPRGVHVVVGQLLQRPRVRVRVGGELLPG